MRGTGKIHGQQSSRTATILVAFRQTQKKEGGGERSYAVQQKGLQEGEGVGNQTKPTHP
jgi:hypothetical protein